MSTPHYHFGNVVRFAMMYSFLNLVIPIGFAVASEANDISDLKPWIWPISEEDQSVGSPDTVGGRAPKLGSECMTLADQWGIDRSSVEEAQSLSRTPKALENETVNSQSRSILVQGKAKKPQDKTVKFAAVSTSSFLERPASAQNQARTRGSLRFKKSEPREKAVSRGPQTLEVTGVPLLECITEVTKLPPPSRPPPLASTSAQPIKILKEPISAVPANLKPESAQGMATARNEMKMSGQTEVLRDETRGSKVSRQKKSHGGIPNSTSSSSKSNLSTSAKLDDNSSSSSDFSLCSNLDTREDRADSAISSQKREKAGGMPDGNSGLLAARKLTQFLVDKPYLEEKGEFVSSSLKEKNENNNSLGHTLDADSNSPHYTQKKSMEKIPMENSSTSIWKPILTANNIERFKSSLLGMNANNGDLDDIKQSLEMLQIELETLKSISQEFDGQNWEKLEESNAQIGLIHEGIEYYLNLKNSKFEKEEIQDGEILFHKFDLHNILVKFLEKLMISEEAFQVPEVFDSSDIYENIQLEQLKCILDTIAAMLKSEILKKEDFNFIFETPGALQKFGWYIAHFTKSSGFYPFQKLPITHLSTVLDHQSFKNLLPLTDLIGKNNEKWQILTWNFWRFKVKDHFIKFPGSKTQDELKQIFFEEENFFHLKSVVDDLANKNVERKHLPDYYYDNEGLKEKQRVIEAQNKIRQNIQYLIKKWSEDKIEVHWRSLYDVEETAQIRYGVMDFFQSQFGQDSMKKLWLESNKAFSLASKIVSITGKENFERFLLRNKLNNLAIKLNDQANIEQIKKYFLDRSKIKKSADELNKFHEIYLKNIENLYQEIESEIQKHTISQTTLEKKFKIHPGFFHDFSKYKRIMSSYFELQ